MTTEDAIDRGRAAFDRQVWGEAFAGLSAGAERSAERATAAG
jgi:hypothetical protein